jgi:F0F1-type ATP synthase delta subunit
MRIKIGTKTLDNSLISRLERLKRHTVGMKTIVGE